MGEEKKLFESQVRLRDNPDHLKTVQIEAVSKDEAVQKLIAQGYMVISVRDTKTEGKTPARESLFSFSFASKTKDRESKPLFSFLQRISTRELIFFAIQLSTLLKAGVPLMRSLDIIRRGMKNPKFKAVLEQLSAKVSGGTSLTVALKQFPDIFPWVWLNLVEVGESTGKLPQCLEEVAHYQESAARIKTKVITAFFYPAILTCAVVGAVTFLLLFIVPKFEEIFRAQNMTLPVITQIVIQASNLLRNHSYLLLVVLALFIAAFIYIKRVPKARVFVEMSALSAPVFGPLLWQVAVVKFSRGFSTLLKSGVPILQSLDIGARLTENKFLELKMNEVAQAVKGGQGLGVQLETHQVFPVFMTQLVAVGEETGQIDKFLDIIAVYYEDQVDEFLTRLSTMIEPLLLVVMGAVVGTVVISMFLPIIELSTSGGMGA